MKKTIIILSALLIALGLTQCKKNEQPTDNQDDAVTITLQIKGNDGTKVLVNTETGSVDYEVGDQIFVASAGKYVGTLTYNGIVFAGAIANATEGLPLQFYFFGNIAPAETLTSGITESCSVVITDQTAHLPVISAAPSYENYYGNVTDYTAVLLNKCALVKFNVTTSSTAATCIKGMNNKVTVDFSTNVLGFDQVNDGVITVPAGNGERWAILLPQGEVSDATACSADGMWEGTCGDIPAITANSGLPDGIAVTIETVVLPEGAINGLFTINANGDKVFFSQGNLKYTKSVSAWSFMEHQYDMVEFLGQDVGENYANQDVVSMFGWGTGSNPTNTSESNSDYPDFDDWGNNAISNGGNTPNLWRTLSFPEWKYVLRTRETPSGIRIAMANVMNVNGVIILPDNWSASTYDLNNTNQIGASFSSNIIPAASWTTLQDAGAVFLPTSGYRYGTLIQNVGTSGEYWSSSDSGPSGACCIGIEDEFLGDGYVFRDEGKLVRLVCDVQ